MAWFCWYLRSCGHSFSRPSVYQWDNAIAEKSRKSTHIIMSSSDLIKLQRPFSSNPSFTLLERCVMHVPSIAHPSIHCGFESGETSKAEIFSDIMTSSPLAVAVVGAGAAGLCAARHLASNPQVICNHTHYYWCRTHTFVIVATYCDRAKQSYWRHLGLFSKHWRWRARSTQVGPFLVFFTSPLSFISF